MWAPYARSFIAHPLQRTDMRRAPAYASRDEHAEDGAAYHERAHKRQRDLDVGLRHRLGDDRCHERHDEHGYGPTNQTCDPLLDQHLGQYPTTGIAYRLEN